MTEDVTAPMTKQAKLNMTQMLTDWAEILVDTYTKLGLVLPKEEAVHRAWVLLIRGATPSDMDKAPVNPLDMLVMDREPVTSEPFRKGKYALKPFAAIDEEVTPEFPKGHCKIHGDHKGIHCPGCKILSDGIPNLCIAHGKHNCPDSECRDG